MIKRVINKIIDFVWPMCPSGLPHRVRLGVVVNDNGNLYCYHKDCMKANYENLRTDKTRCPNCFDKIVVKDDPMGVCIPCGGKNRPLSWIRL